MKRISLPPFFAILCHSLSALLSSGMFCTTSEDTRVSKVLSLKVVLVASWHVTFFIPRDLQCLMALLLRSMPEVFEKPFLVRNLSVVPPAQPISITFASFFVVLRSFKTMSLLALNHQCFASSIWYFFSN